MWSLWPTVRSEFARRGIVTWWSLTFVSLLAGSMECDSTYFVGEDWPKDFHAVERLVDWADLANTPLLRHLWREGFWTPIDCINFAFEPPCSYWISIWLPDVVRLDSAQIYRFLTVCYSTVVFLFCFVPSFGL